MFLIYQLYSRGIKVILPRNIKYDDKRSLVAVTRSYCKLPKLSKSYAIRTGYGHDSLNEGIE